MTEISDTWKQTLSVAKDAISFVNTNLRSNDPLRKALTAVIVLTVVVSFIAIVYALLRDRLFDAMFITVALALLALLIAITFAAVYPRATSQKRRSARDLLAVIFVAVIVVFCTVHYSLSDVVRSGRFNFEYARLLMGAESIQSFSANATRHGLSDVVGRLGNFVAHDTAPQLPIPGMRQDRSLSPRPLLWALTEKHRLTVRGTRTVDRPWQTGTIVFAADTVEFESADITIGRYDLVIIANTVKVEQFAHIRAFPRRGQGDPAPTNSDGTGLSGLPAGDVYLVVFNGTEPLDIDLRGEDGGPGAPGQDGHDGPDLLPTDSVRTNNAVGSFHEVQIEDLRKRRDSYLNSTENTREVQDAIIRACGEKEKCIIGDCIRRAKPGIDGKDASDAALSPDSERGRTGGAGGAGGHLYIYYWHDRQDAIVDEIAFDTNRKASGGKGGAHGRPGRGSRGGVVAPEGADDPYSVCGRGDQGKNGLDGKLSTDGNDGQPGQIPARVEPEVINFQTLFGSPIAGLLPNRSEKQLI